MRALARRRVLAVLLMVGSVLPGLALVAGCEKRSKDDSEKSEGPLPELRIGDDTPNLMLTWIDGHGGTHVEVTPNRVPDEGRKLVRVIVTGSDHGLGDPIYVTDLTDRASDGMYATRSMTRHEWEDEIARRRGAIAALPDEDDGKERVPRSPHHGQPPGGGDPGGGKAPDRAPAPDDGPAPGDAFKNVAVTIYGASWCGPCHMALDHLKHLHVAATFKDIEKDAGARDEMSAKLARAGQRGGSIPVIDVGGRIMIGYDQGALDQALDRASGGTAL